MSILRGIFGKPPDETARLEPVDLPRGAWLDLPDESLDASNLRRFLNPAPDDDWQNLDIHATLRHAPTGDDPDAVVVEIDGKRVGYLPREASPKWAAYLDALAARGRMPRVTGELGANGGHWNPRTRKRDRTIFKVTLYADADADYPLPEDA